MVPWIKMPLPRLSKKRRTVLDTFSPSLKTGFTFGASSIAAGVDLEGFCMSRSFFSADCAWEMATTTPESTYDDTTHSAGQHGLAPQQFSLLHEHADQLTRSVGPTHPSISVHLKTGSVDGKSKIRVRGQACATSAAAPAGCSAACSKASQRVHTTHILCWLLRQGDGRASACACIQRARQRHRLI